MSLFQAGATLLGGLLGKSKGVSPSAQAYGHVKGLMRASEEFGFNPLTLLQSGVPGGHTAANNAPMGQAFADAAMFAADAFLKQGNQQALQLNQYQEQNRKLQERLTHVTLNPKVPGIYGGGDGAAAVVAGEGLSGDEPAGLRPAGPAGQPLKETDRGFFADERRAVDNVPVTSSPGYMLVDNPAFPLPLRVPTLDGDEPLHWYDYPDLVLPAGVMLGDLAFSGNGGGIHTAFKERPLTKAEEAEERRMDNGFAKRPKPRPTGRRDKYGSSLPLKSSEQSWSW